MGGESHFFEIDLPAVRRHWENVDLLRTSILNYTSCILENEDIAHSFATIAAELLENAIKYGADDEETDAAGTALHLRVWGDASEARVQVDSPIKSDSSKEDAEEVLRTIDWLKKFPTAEEAYHARLMEVAMSDSGVSKLGLARIAYETNCDLHAEIVDDGSILRVTTVTKLA
jgi:hypothetical protein